MVQASANDNLKTMSHCAFLFDYFNGENCVCMHCIVFFILDLFDDELDMVMSGEMFSKMTLCEVKGCENVNSATFQHCGTPRIFTRLAGLSEALHLQTLVPHFIRYFRCEIMVILMLCCQVSVPAPADVLQQNGQSDGEVDLPAEHQQRPPQSEERHHPPSVCEPPAKGCCSDSFQDVSV